MKNKRTYQIKSCDWRKFNFTVVLIQRPQQTEQSSVSANGIHQVYVLLQELVLLNGKPFNSLFRFPNLYSLLAIRKPGFQLFDLRLNYFVSPLLQINSPDKFLGMLLLFSKQVIQAFLKKLDSFVLRRVCPANIKENGQKA